MVLLALGMTVAGASYQRWDRTGRALRLGTGLPPTSLTRLVAGGLVLVTAGLIALAALGLL